MAGKRTYDDPCGLARALDAVGERWALLVVRELLLGPKRFSDLSRGLGGMSQNVLSQRLRELEQTGVVRRKRLGPPASTSGYELTEIGRLLDPVLVALATFGSRLEMSSSHGGLSADAFILALRTTFDPRLAGDLALTYELRLDDDVFHGAIHNGRFQVARGSGAQPDVVLTGDVETLRGIVFGGRSLAAAMRGGDVFLQGERTTASRFVAVFPRPKAAVLTA